MYRSTDAQGKPVAVTGTYIEPDVPWPGNGPRPLLAYATAPYGMGEQCAPSKLFNQGIRASLDTGFDLMFNIEEGFIATLLARGFAIVITDGVGLGVHGPMAPQFLNRLAGGTAVLDAARAAMRLPGTSLNPHGPVAFWGWLAGGHSALAAAELAASYAPELNVVGTYANAAPPDLPTVLTSIDGNFLAGSIGWVLRGIQESYPATSQPIWDSLTPRSLGDHSDKFGKAVDSLSALVHGLEARKEDLSTGLAYANEGAGTLADLLSQARPPLQKTIQETERAAGAVVADHDYFDDLLNTLPDAYRVLNRQALSGDFFSFYLCHVVLKMNGKGGQPVYVKVAGQATGRCTPQ